MKIYYDSNGDGVEDTQISNVLDFPKITTRLDEIGICSFTIIDKLGTLYSTFEPLDFVKIKIEDDNSNVLFRGYITDKIFNHNKLTISCHGIGKRLEWKTFSKNYILAEGLVADVPATEGASYIDLKEDDEDNGNPAFNFATDSWITNRDVGLLITDNTSGISTESFTVSSITDDGTADAEANAVVANVTTPFDSPEWECQDIHYGDYSMYQKFVLNAGTPIDGAKYIGNLRLHFRFRIQSYLDTVNSTQNTGLLQIAIKKTNDVYTTFKWFYISHTFGVGGVGGTKNYYIGVGQDGEGNTVDDYLNGAGDVYIDLDGASDYDEITIKATLTGNIDGNNGYFKIYADYMAATVEYASHDISPIMETITDNDADWVRCTGVTWANTGVAVDDYFKIGESTTLILKDAILGAELAVQLDSTLTKYIARWYKGSTCLEVLRDICELEDVHWWEDYTYDRIVVAKEADFTDSTVNLTNASFDWNWKIHDTPNHYKKINVFGNAALRIYAFAEDVDSTSLLEKNIINESIATVPDAQELADAELAKLDTKRISIEQKIQGVQSNLQLGTTVDLSMVNPTLTDTYSIRKIERNKEGYVGTDDIWTTIHYGLGKSSLDEKLSGIINRSLFTARRAQQDRLIATPLSTGGIINVSWGDIAGTTSGVQAVITAQLIDGQSIDNAIDALINTHHDAASTDHDDRYYTETETDAFKLNKWVAPDGAVAMGSQKLTGLAKGTNANDALALNTNLINTAYDPDVWTETDVTPSRLSVKNALVPLQNATVYRGTWSPRATYNFTEELGDTGTDISFVDTANVYNGACEIIASWQGREKILRLQDDATAGEDPNITHTITQATSGTHEFYIGTNAVAEDWWFFLHESGHDSIVVLRVVTGNLYYRDNVDGWQLIQAMSNDIFYRFKVIWRADNTFDVYINGTKEVDNVATNNNMVSGIDQFWIRGYGDSTDYIYLDSYRENDTAVYPTEGDGFWYLVDQDGYAAADGSSDTPARWYEIGDWIVWNPTRNVWDILRNVQGDNILKVSSGDSIQTAIDELESIGKGVIVLLSGTHVITSELNIGDTLATVDLEIRGMGDTSIIECDGDIQTFDINNCGSLTLKDFKIDASDITTQARVIIDVNAVNDNPIVIENLTITGDGTNGYGIYITSKDVIIRNCRMDNIYYGMLLLEKQIKVYENYFYDIDHTAIYVGNSNRHVIFDNYIDGNGEVTNYGIFVRNTDYSTVNDNYVYDCTTGIKIDIQADRNSITGNTVVACSGSGIEIDIGDYNTVTANMIIGCGDGIWLLAGASNNYITVNMIENSTNEDIDDDSDGTNYRLDKDSDMGFLSLRVESSNGVMVSGLPYMGDNTRWFLAQFKLPSQLDVSKDIDINWTFKREGAWVGPSLDLTSQIGRTTINGLNVIDYTNIENANTSIACATNQKVVGNGRTIAGGTATAGQLIAMKMHHNDADPNAVTCLGVEVVYQVARSV